MIKLGHVNVRTACLEESVAFYRDVLGLGPDSAATRPESPDHVWMRDTDGNPCIHLQRSTGAPAGGVTCGVHHMAFDCRDPQRWRAKLASLGVDYDETEFAVANMVQFNLTDPNGVRIELTFATAPDRPAQ